MSEEQAKYTITPEESADAPEMLGAGYEVHAPSVVLQADENNHLIKTKEEAWIKLSTTFRKVMPKLKGADLAVFIAVCLGINGQGETYPTLDTLAKWSGYSRRATIEAVNDLESMGFLTIVQGVKKSNLYKVKAFAAFGEHNTPTSAEFAPVQKTADGGAISDTENAQNVLKIAPELESLTRTINQSENEKSTTFKEETFNTPTLQEERKKVTLPDDMPLDWQIGMGASNEKLASLAEKERTAKELLDAYERAMGYNPLDWPKFDRLQKFLLTKTVQEIQAFAKWSRRDFSTCTPAKARQNPQLVIDLWPQAFLQSTPARSQEQPKPDTRRMVTPQMLSEVRNATR